LFPMFPMYPTYVKAANTFILIQNPVCILTFQYPWKSTRLS
jgi:hypothetical protein